MWGGDDCLAEREYQHLLMLLLCLQFHYHSTSMHEGREDEGRCGEEMTDWQRREYQHLPILLLCPFCPN